MAFSAVINQLSTITFSLSAHTYIYSIYKFFNCFQEETHPWESIAWTVWLCYLIEVDEAVSCKRYIRFRWRWHADHLKDCHCYVSITTSIAVSNRARPTQEMCCCSVLTLSFEGNSLELERKTWPSWSEKFRVGSRLRENTADFL